MSSSTSPVRVLSLDGGGVRGIAILVILEHLVRIVRGRLRNAGASQDEEVLPADLFDHIVGTSTGGLIAVMLVKLNMPVSACIQTYKELLPRIFGRRQFGSCFGGLGVPRYSEKTLQKCLQGVFGRYGKKEAGTINFMEESNIGGTKTTCSVVCRELHPSGGRMHHPAFICSHYCRSTSDSAGKYTPYELWKACRATTAAPTFFAPMEIHGRLLVDGAFGNTNNPTRKAHFHFLSNIPGYKDRPVIWLNNTKVIGANHISAWLEDRLIPNAIREARNLLRDLEAIAVDADRVEEEMEDVINSRANRQLITFARVSANNGVADVQLDDWRSLDKIEHLTRLYLEQPDVQAKLNRIADPIAAETLERRRLHKRHQASDEEALKLELPSAPFASTSREDISPLPSPMITLSRPGRESQYSASISGLSPLGPSPISPLTRVTTNDTIKARSRKESTPSVPSPIHEKSQKASGIDSKHVTTTEKQDTTIIQPSASIPETPADASPVLINRGHAPKSTQDLLADISALPGMSIPNEKNESRFSNLTWQVKDEVDQKWKRRTTVF